MIYRRSKVPPEIEGSDKVIGYVLLVIASFYALLRIGLLLFAGSMVEHFGPLILDMGQAEIAQVKGVIATLAIFSLLVGVVNALIGWGITRGSSVAFWSSGVLNSIYVVLNLILLFTFGLVSLWETVVCGMVAVYAIWLLAYQVRM